MSSLRNSYGRITNVQEERKLPIFRPFTDDGTITGNRNMNVNGSVTPQEFYLQPGPNLEYSVLGLSVRVTDSGNPAFDDYGNVNGPLANGVTFFVVQGGIEIPLTPNIKRNIDWLEFGPQISIEQFANSVRFITYVLDMSKFSTGIVLDGTKNERFGCRINDDLTGLVSHEIGIQGFLRFLEV